MSTTHLTTVALDPADWAVATWRPRPALPRPAPPEFTRAIGMRRLKRLVAGQSMYVPTDWGRLRLADALSPEEAHFWLYAMTDVLRDPRHPDYLKELEALPLTGHPTREAVRDRLRQRPGLVPPLVLRPLADLFTPEQLIDVLLDERLYEVDGYRVGHYEISNLQSALLDGYRRHVRPYLDEPTLDRARQAARTRIPAALWTQPAAPTHEQLMGYRLAPVLGLYAELAALVGGWADDLFTRSNHFEEWRRHPRDMIFGLGDPWLVEQHLRRLKLLLRHETDARAWLAHTEANALDFLADSVRGGTPHLAGRLIDALCLVRAPAAVRPLLEVQLAGHGCAAIRRWFEQQVGHAVAGALPLAAGRGKIADAARDVLRDARRRGHAAVIEAQLATVEPAQAKRIRATILAVEEVTYPPLDDAATPEWFRQGVLALPPLSPQAWPDWVRVDDLPPLVVGGKRLNDRQVDTLLRAVHLSKLDAPPPLLTDVRANVDGPRREAFVWRLIDHCRQAGALAREGWVLHMAGLLGGDESALKLAALVRDGKGTAGRRRALVILDCLAAIGSALALQQLIALARQARSRQFRDRAKYLIAELAKKRGISQAELEDVAVPTLGFGREVGPMFDYGPRLFEAVLATGPRLLVRDEAGAVRDDLPAPQKKDDAGLVRRSQADWRLLRKTVRQVFKEQAARLERAMVSGQRWTARHFRQRILGQPLLAQLARLVVWGGYDDRGRLACTFRLTDEDAFVDGDERPVPIADLNSVRIVHPIELPGDVREAWAAVWRDHELIAPFAQLGRKLYPLLAEEKNATAITAYRGRRLPALTLAGEIKARDWTPALLGHAQHGEAHRKEFRTYGLTAVVHHPHVGPMTYPSHLAHQELRAAYFVQGPVPGDVAIDVRRAVPLGQVQDLPRSEVHEVLAYLHGKGKAVT